MKAKKNLVKRVLKFVEFIIIPFGHLYTDNNFAFCNDSGIDKLYYFTIVSMFVTVLLLLDIYIP